MQLDPHPHTNPRKATHLVDRYDAIAKTVTCDCGWYGPESEYQPHRKLLGAQKKQRMAAQALEATKLRHYTKVMDKV